MLSHFLDFVQKKFRAENSNEILIPEGLDLRFVLFCLGGWVGVAKKNKTKTKMIIHAKNPKPTAELRWVKPMLFRRKEEGNKPMCACHLVHQPRWQQLGTVTCALFC